MATGFHSTATGTQSVSSGRGATATGWQAQATGGLSTATGNSAVASGASSTAAGRAANASADNSVALGANSVADRANSVSVGSAGNERQVTNIADASQDMDAVNLRQLNASFAQAMAAPTAAINDLRLYVDDRFRVQDERIDQMGAMSSATANATASLAGIRTPNRVAVGAGFSGGESAVSVGYQRVISDRAAITISGAFSGDDSSAGIGFGFGW